jgi:hypothetical protein
MPLFVNISKTLEEKSKEGKLGKNTFIENLIEDRKNNSYNNLISEAIDLIEEEQYDLDVEEDTGMSDDERTTSKKQSVS